MSETSILVMRYVLLPDDPRLIPAARQARRIAQSIDKFFEGALQFRRGHALMLLHEMRQGSLSFQCLECRLHRLVVNVGEEECSLDLAALHISYEGVDIAGARKSHTMLPHSVDKVPGLGGHAPQISFEIAVEIRLKY